MTRPRALDLFCGAGGVSEGLRRAGFDVTGVDIAPMPHYRGGTFVQADALTYPLDGFDFVWASPPCQAYTVSRTRAKGHQDREHPELVHEVRHLLARWEIDGILGGPCPRKRPRLWAIENVPGAPMRRAVTLCGGAFGLGATGDDGTFRPLRRHRLIETSWLVLAPPCHCGGDEKIGVYGNGGGWANRCDPDRRGYKGNAAEAREAMGISWMPMKYLSQAIPPAYAEWIGREALAMMEAAA